MLNRFKSAIYNVVGNLDQSSSPNDRHHDSPAKPVANSHDIGPQPKFRYTRPAFLQLNTDDEIQVSADHIIRPIIVPRDITKLPYNSGYAETINAGKSIRNEDQAAVYRGLLRAIISEDNIALKVADMMPTVPGYPQQVPVNSVIRSKTQVNGKSKDSEPTEETNKEQNSGNLKSPENGPVDNPVKLSDTSKVTNGTVDSNGDLAIELDSKTAIDDLASPTTPLPIELRLAEAATETVESAYATPQTSPTKKKAIVEESLPWVYFGVFDGHAGSGVAVAAANTLHKIIQEKLQVIADLLITFGLNSELKFTQNNDSSSSMNGSVIINQDNFLPKDNIALLFNPAPDKLVTVDNLITGALEMAFWEMDNQIANDKLIYKMSGGCTATIALFILGKLYIANAGDSRGIICKGDKVIPMSFDFTPESERERIKYLGLLRPEFLGNDFTHLEFVRRPARRDLGRKLLYRDAYMTGWAYKTITIDDLKFPLIYGEGKRSRVLATIGVTRGFGDHELKAQNSDVDIKPFLSAQPEVRIYDLENDETLTDGDVLILGTDGLWDITSNEQAAEIVSKSLEHFPANDIQRFKYRYISAAQDLVMHSRGKAKEKGRGWKTADNKPATIDDISVFVVPLKPYREDYIKWKSARDLIKSQSER